MIFIPVMASEKLWLISANFCRIVLKTLRKIFENITILITITGTSRDR